MGRKQAKPARDSSSRALALRIVGDRPVRLQVAVANPVDGETAVLQEGEFAAVLGTDRPQAAVALAVVDTGLADGVQGSLSGLAEHRKAQCFQIAAIGRQADLRAAAEVGLCLSVAASRCWCYVRGALPDAPL